MYTVQLKRKSYGKIQPQLPTVNYSKQQQIDPSNRTQHVELASPLKQLQAYRRKEISISSFANPQSSEKKKSSFHLNLSKKSEVNTKHFKSNSIVQNSIMKLSPTDTTDFSGHLKTDYTHARINTISIQQMGQSRFQDDHHNTNSLAELMGNNNSIHPDGLETQRKNLKVIIPQNLNKQSLGSLQDDDQQVSKKFQKLSINEQQDDGYLPGEQAADYKQEQKANEVTGQNYKNQHGVKLLARQMPDNYKPITQPQCRMEQVYWLSQRKRLMKINEDIEMISMMQKYQRIKSEMKMKLRRKYELKNTISMLKNHIPGTIKNTYQKPQKSLSLPSLKQKISIGGKVIDHKDVNEKRLFKNNEIDPGSLQYRLKNSLSAARLTKKKQQPVLMEQLSEYQKQLPKYGQVAFIPPSKDLFSNAHYKKFPLGY